MIQTCGGIEMREDSSEESILSYQNDRSNNYDNNGYNINENTERPNRRSYTASN